MELGVALPTSAPFASTAQIIRIAKAPEKFGYAALWTYERLLRPVGDLPQRPRRPDAATSRGRVPLREARGSALTG